MLDKEMPFKWGKNIAISAIFSLSLVTTVLAVQTQETVISHPLHDRLDELPQILAQRQKRTALVIGNSNYGEIGNLNSYRNNSVDMEKALRKLGFQVIHVKDGNKHQIVAAIEEFRLKLRQGGVGIFYYSGLTAGGPKIVPVGVNFTQLGNRTFYLRSDLVSMVSIADLMRDGISVNYFFIDSCNYLQDIIVSRKQLYKGWFKGNDKRNLAFTGVNLGVCQQVERRNSIFTESLLASIQTPGLTAEELVIKVGRDVSSKKTSYPIAPSYNPRNMLQQSSLIRLNDDTRNHVLNVATTSVNVGATSQLTSPSTNTAVQPSSLRQTNSLSQSRYALVIGNSNYGSNNNLKNPVNDSQDMAESLRSLGFKVKLHQDITKRQFITAIEQFNQQLRNGGVGLFYFAGHGVQVKGVNYLIPVGATITIEQDVEFEGVPLDRILGAMEDAKNPVNLVLIDACRENLVTRSWSRSFTGTRGFAPIKQATLGTLISFATAPGTLAKDGDGRNSPYTASLLKHIKTPGLTVESMFKRVRRDVRLSTKSAQITSEVSNLEGEFYFSPKN